MPIRPVRLTQLSFTGMRDSLDPSTADARKALLMQNVYPSDASEGASTVGRPGFQQSGSTLNSGFSVQGIGQYSKLDGTETTVGFCGGQMFTFNWTSRVWTNVPLGGGAALSTTAAIDTVNFANVLIVSDGVNTPFQWDGTTFTVLSNAPVWFGPPTVYYGRLFAVKASDHTTIDWSEANQPNTGYEAGGFNNSWTLGQTQQDAIYRLVGTNAALYYWRQRSTGVITGAVTATFSSDGTKDGISETIGSTAPRSFVVYNQAIYFLSADGRPHALAVGGGLKEDLWTDLRETLVTVNRSLLPSSVAVGDPLTQMALVSFVAGSQITPQQYAAIDTRTNLIGGLWSGFSATAMALVKDDQLIPRIMHGTSNGNVYDHGDPNGSLWDDENATIDGGTLAIAHAVTGTPLGYDLQYDKIFDRIDLSMRLQTNLTEVSFDYTTPYGTSPQAYTLTDSLTWDKTGVTWDDLDPTWDATLVRGGAQEMNFTSSVGAQWDSAVWDTDFWPADELEMHFAFGLAGRGRWITPRIQHAFGTERFGLEGWVVTAFPDADDPAIP